MQALSDTADVERFHQFISRWLGLDLDERNLNSAADLLRRRAEDKKLPVRAYLSGLEAPDPPQAELRLLAQELTVTETSFFRNADQMRAFAETALPDRLEARSIQRKLRILSAGCASGEEAYSLAILVRNCAPAMGWDISIRGIDANIAMLQKAQSARYSSWSLRQAQSAEQARFFRSEGRDFALADEIRKMAEFEERNLAAEDDGFWRADSFDIVFCRNVMMYFTPEVAHAVVSRITRSLAPGGFLFLGHAETLRGLSQDFHLCHTHGTFYYQRKDEAGLTAPPLAAAAPGFAAMPFPADDSWIDTIHRASQRVESLTRSGAREARTRGVPVPVLDLGPALDLLQREKFSDARMVLDALPSEMAQDPEVLLLNAVLLTHGGDLAAAEKVCSELLARDEMSAGAHYLMALCREGAGDRAGAADHDRVAAYLDPGFAMPHLHLGLLARRAGDRAEARQQLTRALLLLQREDVSRLLLFGGGFGREQLAALCRAELARCAS